MKETRKEQASRNHEQLKAQVLASVFGRPYANWFFLTVEIFAYIPNSIKVALVSGSNWALGIWAYGTQCNALLE